MGTLTDFGIYEKSVIFSQKFPVTSSFPLAKLYRLSHFWYGAVGALSTIIIGWLVSMATSE